MTDFDDKLPDQFRQSLTEAIQVSKFKSERKLAQAAGLTPSAILQMRRPPAATKSEKGPGLFMVAKAAAALDTSVDRLLGLNERGRPSWEALLSRWAGGCRDQDGFADALEHCLIYKLPLPGDTNLEVLHMGNFSLAREITFLKTSKRLQLAINKVGKTKEKMELLAGIQKVNDVGFLITFEHLRTPALPALVKAVSVKYLRLLLKVKGPGGDDRVLVFAHLIEDIDPATDPNFRLPTDFE